MLSINDAQMKIKIWDTETEVDFSDNIELLECIKIANKKWEVINLQVQVRDRVYYITNKDLYF